MKMIYKPLEIDLLEVHGFIPSLRAMRKPKGTEIDSFYDGDTVVIGGDDRKLAKRLVRAGTDHAKFSRGIIAYMELKLQVGWMVEFETYRAGVECLSTSSEMHGILKEMSGEELAELKQKRLPELVYTRSVMISYQALRSMYRARRLHRHPDWRIFCNFIETLPHFSTFIYPEAS